MSSIFDPRSYYLNAYALPYFIVGGLVMLEGFFILTQSKKSMLPSVYFLTAFIMAVWLTGVGFVRSALSEETSMIWARYYAWFAICFVNPTIYMFSACWLDPSLRNQNKFIALNYVIALGFYILCISTPYIVEGLWNDGYGFYARAGKFEWVFIGWFYTLMTLAFVNFSKTYRAERDQIQRKNKKLMFIAFIIAFTGSVEYLPNYGVSIFPIAYAPLFVFTTLMGYCVIRYQLMDIETVIHKTIMWVLTSSVIAIPILLFYYSLKDWIYHLPDIAFLTLITVTIVLALSYIRHIQPHIDHLFQRRQRDLTRSMEQFTDALVHLRTLEEVTRHVLSTVKNVFYAANVTLFVLDENLKCYKLICDRGFTGKKADLDADDPFMNWFRDHDILVLKEHLTADPQLVPIALAGKEYFQRINGLMAVPLIVGNKLLGVLNIGKKVNLQRFRSSELSFLLELRRNAAIALSNSLHIIAIQENLKRWNEELEKKVIERTKQLEETQAQLTQAEKLATIGTLSGGIAHEINNPLTAVLTNAQILKMTANEEDMESISLIEEGARRCQIIIQKLMKYARKPMAPEKIGTIDINAVVRNTAAFLNYQLKQDNIELITEGSAGLSCVQGNANELEQVFTNLILNAKDALLKKEDAREIRISTAERNGSIYITVADNGSGIPKENLTKIFDPFFTTKEIGKGTGLGLAVTFGIIEKHQGKIDVTSEMGRGTSFTVMLPK